MFTRAAFDELADKWAGRYLPAGGQGRAYRFIDCPGAVVAYILASSDVAVITA